METQALEYVRKYMDIDDFNYKRCRAMEMRCAFSHAYPIIADDITDLLEEYGEDNDYPECWWCEYGDIDDIIELI